MDSAGKLKGINRHSYNCGTNKLQLSDPCLRTQRSLFCVTGYCVYLSVSADHDYLIPKRAVTTVEGMQIWEKSEAYYVCCKNYFNCYL
jgi:hypothetical protein